MNKIKRYLFIFVMGRAAFPGMEFFAKIARVLRRRGTGEPVFFRYSENASLNWTRNLSRSRGMFSPSLACSLSLAIRTYASIFPG